MHRGRGNALAVMGRILSALREKCHFRLAEIHGGDKTNAIPRECTALLVGEDMAAVERALPTIFDEEKKGLTAPEDGDAALTLTPAPVHSLMSEGDTARVLSFLAIKSGVLKMREQEPIMPAASRNLASVRTTEGAVTFGLSSRASDSAVRDAVGEEIATLAASLGGTCAHYNPYCGWEEPFHGKLLEDWQRAYRTVTGRETVPTLIHAGLETGVITSAVKGLSAIAVGCNIYDLHTPRDRMELSSFARIYSTVLEFLKIV